MAVFWVNRSKVFILTWYSIELNFSFLQICPFRHVRSTVATENERSKGFFSRPFILRIVSTTFGQTDGLYRLSVRPLLSRRLSRESRMSLPRGVGPSRRKQVEARRRAMAVLQLRHQEPGQGRCDVTATGRSSHQGDAGKCRRHASWNSRWNYKSESHQVATAFEWNFWKS